MHPACPMHAFRRCLGKPLFNVYDGQSINSAYSTYVKGKENKVNKSSHWYQEIVMPWLRQEDLTNHLSSNIIYHDEHMIAFNKPTGLPMHGLKYTTEKGEVETASGEDISMKAVMGILKQHLNIDIKGEIFSQNRLYSGVTAYAKTEECQGRMKRYFRHIKANKGWCQQYLVLLDGSVTDEGEEDFPIDRKIIEHENTSMMMKAAKISKTARGDGRQIVPRIRHKVLDILKSSQATVSLVEVEPTLASWDSIPLYFVDKLSPVLGDHTYSARVKTLGGSRVPMKPKFSKQPPQSLPYDVTKALDLMERQTYYMPLHVHCSHLTLPKCGAPKSESIDICAPLPDYFQQTYERLKVQFAK